MKILIAEDDLVSRRILESTLTSWGHNVVVTCDGKAAWQVMRSDDAPQLAILDWMMPEMDGLQLCRKIRNLPFGHSVFIILLTAKSQKSDIVIGLDGGANDYIIKPFDRQELRARIQVGTQMVELQLRLAHRVKELEQALAHVKTLEALLPICSYCKKIRDEDNGWQQAEAYIESHSGSRFSHGICPHCWETVVEPEMAAAIRSQESEFDSPAKSP